MIPESFYHREYGNTCKTKEQAIASMALVERTYPDSWIEMPRYFTMAVWDEDFEDYRTWHSWYGIRAE